MAFSWKRLLTVEDLKASFNLFCCVYGIGTLGMPANFARAGPIAATLALVFMASANVFASVAISRVLLAAPTSVRTFGDLGEWVFGRAGRWAVNISQLGVCLLVPCAFLVLGAILLETLFPAALSAYVWIVLMAVTLMPVCLTPTLKERAGAALAGAIGTIAADAIALGIMIYYLTPQERTPPQAHVTVKNVLDTFGNLSLAYGAAIVIPAIQRQHSDPKRVPRVILTTLTFISVLFLAIAVTGYVLVGCQIPGNLLFAVSGTALGFTASRGSIVLAFLAMQLHITIAFAVILHPALYLAERVVLGMHQQPPTKQLSAEPYRQRGSAGGLHSDRFYGDANNGLGLDVSTPERLSAVSGGLHKELCSPDVGTLRQKSIHSLTSVTNLATGEHEEDEDLKSYKQPGVMPRVIILRLGIIAVLVAVSCALKSHFLDLQDFIGASTVSVCCIILPALFYLKVFWRSLPWYEKAYFSLIAIVCTLAGAYSTYEAGRKLFLNLSGPTFPYCPEGDYQTYSYTNQTQFP